jgi:hypothetical protein
MNQSINQSIAGRLYIDMTMQGSLRRSLLFRKRIYVLVTVDVSHRLLHLGKRGAYDGLVKLLASSLL